MIFADRRVRIDDRRSRSPMAVEFPHLSAILRLRFSILVLLLMLSGCDQQMAEQPRYDPLEPSTFFRDGQSARPLPRGTVARGELREDTHLYRGIEDGVPAKTFPFPITMEELQRGRERFNVFCAPCHSRTGDGDGMIVRRGFSRAASLHDPRVRELPPGHLFRVITFGLGAMPSYRTQVEPYDRWAIIAYIRALQLSRNATLQDVPEDQRMRFEREQR